VEKASEVQDFLKRLSGVDSILANTVTGSITIYYNPAEIDPETITHNLSLAGYFDRSKAMIKKGAIWVYKKAKPLTIANHQY